MIIKHKVIMFVVYMLLFFCNLHFSPFVYLSIFCVLLFSSLIFTRTWLRYVRVFAIPNPSVCRLSVAFVHPTHGVEPFGNIYSPLCTLAIVWHPVNVYGDRPRGTLSSKALNARGVAKYSDFGPVECYISRKVQDMASGTIND